MRQLAALGFRVIYEDLGTFSQAQAHHLTSQFTLCQGVPALSVPHPRPRLLWLTVPSHIHLISKYEPDLVIYDAVDEPKEEFAGWSPYYPDIIEQADLIFASAQSIYKHLSALHPNVHLVPNGVDYQHFAGPPNSKPSDMPTSGTVVGYSGAIAPWLDWELLKTSAQNNRDLQFVFIGSLFQLHKFPLKLPNVNYLGLKPYRTLPAYLSHFTLGLIPFRLTEMTKGCNPIKLYEYYAAGLPVLATSLPELFAVPKIQLESDPACFSTRLRQLARPDETAEAEQQAKAERRAFALANDWSERARRIEREINVSLRGLRRHVTP